MQTAPKAARDEMSRLQLNSAVTVEIDDVDAAPLIIVDYFVNIS